MLGRTQLGFADLDSRLRNDMRAGDAETLETGRAELRVPPARSRG